MLNQALKPLGLSWHMAGQAWINMKMQVVHWTSMRQVLGYYGIERSNDPIKECYRVATRVLVCTTRTENLNIHAVALFTGTLYSRKGTP